MAFGRAGVCGTMDVVRRGSFGPTVRASRARDRAGVLFRVLAAVPLNYAATAATVILLARILPGTTAGASIAATFLSFTIFAFLAMTAFAVRHPLKAWALIGGLGIVAGLASWALIAAGGRL
ncbi:hypothetical protein [Sphingomonas sp. ID0503]|uniref:hypothetical protein n=1 Tax=Sphingomonas sp. ID0503 TaxID=3399691 RepID=UPI003AFAE8C2